MPSGHWRLILTARLLARRAPRTTPIWSLALCYIARFAWVPTATGMPPRPSTNEHLRLPSPRTTWLVRCVDAWAAPRVAAPRAAICLKAETILDQAIESANLLGLDDIHARALADRAWVAGLRGQHDLSIRYSYRALSLLRSKRERDRILSNVATGFRFLGALDVARDAYLVLAATAEEQFVRWNAELSLLAIAAEQGSELQFDRYRRDLEEADLSPQLRVSYHLQVGRGYGLLRNVDAGVRHLEVAIEMASAHQLNQLIFDAESALTDLRRQRPTRPLVSTWKSHANEFEEIVSAIESMKELVGAR